MEHYGWMQSVPTTAKNSRKKMAIKAELEIIVFISYHLAHISVLLNMHVCYMIYPWPQVERNCNIIRFK